MKMIKKVRRLLRHFLQNVSLKKTSDILIAFDSDDWGATRVPSLKIRELLDSLNEKMLQDYFTTYDGLESDEDLELLIFLLKKYSDFKGNHPNITLNICVNNPDYKYIYENNFKDYKSQIFFETYSSLEYMNSSNCLALINKGKELSVFSVQMHGSEHLNVLRWMSDGLNSVSIINSCRNGISSCGLDYNKGNRFAYMDELNYYFDCELEFCLNRLSLSKKVLENIFNQKMVCITPSCGVIPKKFKKIIDKLNLKYTKGAFKQFLAQRKKDKLKSVFIVKRKKNGINFLVRNCTFEPTLNRFAVSDCMEDIDYAIKHKKPCIISTHRINYTSRVMVENRDKSLKELAFLIEKILKKYPKAQFVSTDYLAVLAFGKEAGKQ